MQRPYYYQQRALKLRRGVSVIEVLFAMGVAVIGLLGIASLIPLSSKNAADSLHMSEAQALAQDWYSEFTARGLNASGGWLMYRDFGTTGYVAFGKQQGSSTALMTRGCSPAPVSVLRELGRESVCLDPYFLAQSAAQPPGQSGWYRPAVFPYYQDTYNPLVDPAYQASATSSLAWDAQPRMARVTVAGETGSPITIGSLERAFLSTDDFAMKRVDEKDVTIPPVRVDQSSQRFMSTNRYSWFATMTPTEPIPALSTESTIFYTVSLAVAHNREMIIYDPSASATTRRTASTDPPRVEDKPQGERVMWVEPLSGDFIGGNGGRVRLIGNDGFDDDLKSGDWVMLGKTYAAVAVTIPSGPAIRPFTTYRWYRIVSVEQRQSETLLTSPPLPWQLGTLAQVTESGTSTDPYGHSPPNQVWGREVVLEGPDWSFGGVSPPLPVSGGGAIVTPTTATLVRGVKTVIERVITVN